MKSFIVFLLTQHSIASAEMYTDNLKHKNPCLRKYVKIISSHHVASSKCNIEQELELRNDLIKYPRMDLILNVNFWIGSYSKKIKVKELREIKYINVCNGKQVSRSTETTEYIYKEYFKIKNPNLSNSIIKTWDTYALTDKEAFDAFAELKKECLSYDPNKNGKF